MRCDATPSPLPAGRHSLWIERAAVHGNGRKYLAPARTLTAHIAAAELKTIESTQAVMS